MSMDSRARLDYALFQLTPTRTRFDLVLFSGGKNEKITSGLFEPFNTHLKYVRDQIHKGGYSIRLSPPSPTLDAPWFTKLTFQRFVRFVSTPAILERFISLEREILLIERSFEANEVSNTKAAIPREQEMGAAATGDTMKSTETAKVKVEDERNLDLEPEEESSKIQYQRLLGTRKMFLQKEQTMAYAGGLAAGFEMGSIDDLISFADAFGASRLREACIDFKELCKKKHTDRIWMEELAKMEACPHSELTSSGTSGIVLMDGITTNFQSDGKVVSEIASNGSSDVKKSVTVTNQDSLESKKDDKTQSTFETVQVPMPWLHYLPQHFYNCQHPIQQLPPCQTFAFPAVTPGTSPYQMNVQWTPRENDSSLYPAHEVNYQKLSSEKKEKYQNRNGITESGKDRQIESSESESYSDSSAQETSSKKQPKRKKYGKKSSRTVVIRNINYITPKSRNGETLEFSDESSLDESKFIDEDVTVGSLAKSHESNYIPNRSNDADLQNYDDGVVADSSDRGKGNESWDTFKNLLMRDEKETVHIVEKSQPPDVSDECFADKRLEDGGLIGTSPAMNLEMEKIPKQLMAAGDSFVSSKRDGGSDRTTKLEDFENGENFGPIMKRSDCPDEQVLVSQRQEESLNVQNDSLSACAASKSRVITRKEEDWFLVKQSNKPENQDGTFKQTVHGDDCMLSSEGCKYYNEKSRNDVVIDDSFMVQTRIEAENPHDSQWKTDINMVADLAISPMPDSGTINCSQEKNHLGDPFEPNDLCMLLERDSGFVSTPETWTMDYGVDIAFMEGDRMCSGGQRGNHANNELPANGDISRAANNQVRKTKDPTKEAKSKVLNGSNGKRKNEIVTKSKKPSIVSRPNAQKSKLEKEEEIRKNMEELSIQRQKRIAERTAGAGYTAVATKKVPSENKTAKGSIKYEKNKPRSITQGK